MHFGTFLYILVYRVSVQVVYVWELLCSYVWVNGINKGGTKGFSTTSSQSGKYNWFTAK